MDILIEYFYNGDGNFLGFGVCGFIGENVKGGGRRDFEIVSMWFDGCRLRESSSR